MDATIATAVFGARGIIVGDFQPIPGWPAAGWLALAVSAQVTAACSSPWLCPVFRP
jgi:hypothetical protein